MALIKIRSYSSSFSQHSLKDSWQSYSHLPGITPECSNFIWPDKLCYNLIIIKIKWLKWMHLKWRKKKTAEYIRHGGSVFGKESNTDKNRTFKNVSHFH